MTTVRDIMTSKVECINEHDTLLAAAQRMRDLDVGALPICGDDQKLRGVITDRDIVIKCLANGDNPAETEVATLAQGRPVMVNVDDPVDEAIAIMADNQIRRLPVLDGKQLVGIVSQGDLAKAAGAPQVGEMVAAISEG